MKCLEKNKKKKIKKKEFRQRERSNRKKMIIPEREREKR